MDVDNRAHSPIGEQAQFETNLIQWTSDHGQAFWKSHSLHIGSIKTYQEIRDKNYVLM